MKITNNFSLKLNYLTCWIKKITINFISQQHLPKIHTVSINSNQIEILNVSKTANIDEIKKSFRAIAQKYHPDKNPDPKAQAYFVEAKQYIILLITLLIEHTKHFLTLIKDDNMIIKQPAVILIPIQEAMALIKILLMNLMITCTRIKQEHIIKRILKEAQRKEKVKIL